MKPQSNTPQVTIYDSQTGKTLTGYPTEVTPLQFTLVDEQGKELGKFSRDNLFEQHKSKTMINEIEQRMRDSIALNLKSFRGDKSQEQMARKLGIKQRRYAKYEEAKATPPLWLLIVISGLMKKSVNELTGKIEAALK